MAGKWQGRVHGVATQWSSVALDTVGATLISVGVGLMHAPSGVITAGLAVFVLNWRIHGDE